MFILWKWMEQWYRALLPLYQRAHKMICLTVSDTDLRLWTKSNVVLEVLIPIFPGKDIFVGRDEETWYGHA